MGTEATAEQIKKANIAFCKAAKDRDGSPQKLRELWKTGPIDPGFMYEEVLEDVSIPVLWTSSILHLLVQGDHIEILETALADLKDKCSSPQEYLAILTCRGGFLDETPLESAEKLDHPECAGIFRTEIKEAELAAELSETQVAAQIPEFFA